MRRRFIVGVTRRRPATQSLVGGQGWGDDPTIKQCVEAGLALGRRFAASANCKTHVLISRQWIRGSLFSRDIYHFPLKEESCANGMMAHELLDMLCPARDNSLPDRFDNH